jgi:hypothetical protein
MSPSLNSIKDKLESSLDNFSSMDRNPDDSEVEDGWFFWALRSAVDAAGYYTDAKTANQFYKKVSDEINDYVKKNNIETVTTMPSALMSPWRKGYTIKLVNTSIKILKYIISFQDVETTNSVSTSDNANGINKFEAISNNFAYTENSYYSLRGWIFAKDNTELELEVRDYNNNLIDKISFIDSLDVYEAYNEEYKSAKKCRFEVKNYIGNVNLKLVIINKKTKEETVIDLDQPNYEIGNDNYEYNIDSYTKNMYDSITQKSTQKYVDRLNGITKVYQKLNPIVFVVSIICYIIITIKMILNIINKKYQYVPVWLIVTSIILSMLVLIIGVAYNEISSCASINYMYLSGSYPLMLTFEIITIIYTISNCIKKRY